MNCTWDGETWTSADGTACNRDHCAMRGRCSGHVDHRAGVYTCGGCVGRVRKDLAKIAHRCQALHFDAINDGIDSEAMNLIAPSSTPEQVAAKTALEERRGYCNFPRTIPESDEHHPYFVLGRLDMALRETYGPRSDLLVSVATANDYLVTLLARPEFVNGDEFEATAREIKNLRVYLEGVDHDSQEPELGRPCPTCAEGWTEGEPKAAKLRKRYASHPGYKPGQRCDKAHCRTCEGDDDAWHCPTEPAHAWTEAEYRRSVDADYVTHADYLPARELAERLNVPLSVVRKWCARTWNDEAAKYDDPLLISTRSAADGRKLYEVKRAVRLAA